MNTRGIEVHPIDIELDLDDSSLPAESLGLIAESGEARIQSLTVEREAAYRQMQRLMQDISSLRARELSFEVTRQSEMADMMFRIGLVAELRKGGGVEHVVRAGVMSALLANQMGGRPNSAMRFNWLLHYGISGGLLSRRVTTPWMKRLPNRGRRSTRIV